MRQDRLESDVRGGRGEEGRQGGSPGKGAALVELDEHQVLAVHVFITDPLYT